MKKLLFTLLMALISTLGSAKDINTLFQEYRQQKGVEYTCITKDMLKTMLESQLTAGINDSLKRAEAMDEFMKNPKMNVLTAIDSIQVLDFEECKDQQLKDRFMKDAQHLERYGYEVFAQQREKGELIDVYIRANNDVITEFLVFNQDEDGIQLVLISGRLTTSQANEILKNNN